MPVVVMWLERCCWMKWAEDKATGTGCLSSSGLTLLPCPAFSTSSRSVQCDDILWEVQSGGGHSLEETFGNSRGPPSFSFYAGRPCCRTVPLQAPAVRRLPMNLEIFIAPVLVLRRLHLPQFRRAQLDCHGDVLPGSKAH